MTLVGGVVVASNRAAAGVYQDTTGPLLVEFLRDLDIEAGEPVVVQSAAGRGAKPGDRVAVGIPAEHAFLFDADGARLR